MKGSLRRFLFRILKIKSPTEVMTIDYEIYNDCYIAEKERIAERNALRFDDEGNMREVR